VKQSIEKIHQNFQAELQGASSLKELEALKIKYLGKKGLVAEEMKNLRDVPVEEKPHIGKLINDLKNAVETAIDAAYERILLQEESVKLQKEFIDISLPPRRKNANIRTFLATSLLSLDVEAASSASPLLHLITTTKRSCRPH